MIAKITIKDGSFVRGYVRQSEEKLIIKDSVVEWPQRWQVTLRPDALLATSTRVTGKGGNVVSFELGLNGVSRLCLKTTAGARRLISMNQVFTSQKNLDGELYLIYNSNGYRTAFFYSEEFLGWKKLHNITNVVNKDPNTLEYRNRKSGLKSSVVHSGGVAILVSGRLTTITNGNILLKNQLHPTLKKEMQYVNIDNADWVILEKARKKRIERVLVTKQPVFELDLPANEMSQIKKRSEYGLELCSSSILGSCYA